MFNWKRIYRSKDGLNEKWLTSSGNIAHVTIVSLNGRITKQVTFEYIKGMKC